MVDKVELDNLLICLSQGKKEVFDQIYYMTSKSVFAVILSVVKDNSLTEDLMQNTYIKVQSNILSYKPGSNALAWILTIAKNVSLNEYNRRKREVFVDFNENPNQYGEYKMEAQETPLLDLAKQTLKDTEYEIMVLYLVEGMKHKEIAKHINKPIGTVMWVYNNALLKLKKTIKEQGGNQI